MNHTAIIFDLDGTLWDSAKEICMTWNEVVKRHPNCGRTEIKQEELSECLGLEMTAIAAKLFPELSTEKQLAILDECCENENHYLSKHGAKLYPDVAETLIRLKTKHKLFIVSNCQKGYIEAFLTAHKMEKYFDDFECWGNTGLEKSGSISRLMKRNNITDAVYVGDTIGDEKAAHKAGLPFIFAAYGFGCSCEPEYTISCFSELSRL